MTKPRIPLLLVLGVFTGLSAISCGGGDNPAAPAAKAPDAVASFGESGADAAGLGDINTVNVIQGWTITDGCADGKGIRARLWEARPPLVLTGRFTRIFATRNSLGSLRFRLICIRGYNSCIGADTNPLTGTIWGVGLNAERRPAKPFCRVCTTRATSIRLICPRRADGAIEPQLVEGDDAGLDVSGSSVSEDVDEGLAGFDVE